MMKFLGFVFFCLGPFSLSWATIKIDQVDSHKTVIASTSVDEKSDFKIGQVLAIKSQDRESVIGFVRITSIETQGNRKILKAEVARVSQYHFVRTGDQLVEFNLSTESEEYQGSTDLLVRENAPEISARYKPLFTQGVAIGETAQTLWQNEYLMTWYGLIYYGARDWLTVGTWLPGDLTSSPNLTFKARFYNSSSATAATGISFTRDPQNSKNWLVNWNLMADFFDTEQTVSHTFATLAIYTIERAEETTAVKSAGTSTFQTGYEFILDNWNRVLVGPNYNFETKTLGGYFAYLRTWDRFHLQATVYAVNVQNFKWSLTEGYFGYIDAYWRF